MHRKEGIWRTRKTSHSKVHIYHANMKNASKSGHRNLKQIHVYPFIFYSLRDGFILEYVGEVMSDEVAEKRKTSYRQEGRTHFYFMDLQKGEVKKFLFTRYVTFTVYCYDRFVLGTHHFLSSLRWLMQPSTAGWQDL